MNASILARTSTPTQVQENNCICIQPFNNTLKTKAEQCMYPNRVTQNNQKIHAPILSSLDKEEENSKTASRASCSRVSTSIMEKLSPSESSSAASPSPGSANSSSSPTSSSSLKSSAATLEVERGRRGRRDGGG
ncbi:hypothetical protein TorRG33x02_150470 [Trema orientale]|uniref:Uncharacterized protein n=1 Tax=Trema orientale TaxID=63057 RepID=A0A2P5EUG9_TREOI|nr:hypothetical protein TorRG33x02_150470 [Trema orientale]